MTAGGAMGAALHVFLAGHGTDAAGRTLDAVLAMDDRDLERRHDFIQWLFPLPRPSGAVPGAPVMDEATRAALAADPAVGANLRRALARMSAFLRAGDRWLAPHDHNHLRISRMIESLTLLGLPAEAGAFHAEVLARNAAAGSPVSGTSLAHWVRALG